MPRGQLLDRLMRYRYGVLGFLCSLSAITYLDRVCISVAGPRMQNELGLSARGWGWVTGVFSLAYAIFEIPSGHLGDKFGARLMLTRIVLWWSTFTSLTGTVSNFSVLLLIRFCFGAGEAGAYPNMSGSIFHWFPLAERGRAFGLVWMSSQFGGALAPLLVIPIQVGYGWRASFHVFAILGAIWAAAWWLWYRNHPKDKPGIGGKELAEIASPPLAARPTLPWQAILGNASVWALMACPFSWVYAYHFFQSWFHTYLVRARGFTETELKFSALPFLLAGISCFAGGLARDAAVTRWGPKWGPRTIGLSGLASSAACAVAALTTSNKYAALIWLALCYAGINFQIPTVWSTCVDIGRRHAGAIAGCMNTATSLGGLLSSLLFGWLVERAGSYDVALAMMVPALLIGTSLWLRIDATRPISC